ncbi:MAG: PhzF family phenazine biosynthesis protein [Acidobacteriota bacterium]
MKIPIFQIDAFTSRRFSGNPAAVCPLEKWLPEETMQAIAAENNLSETAFLVPRESGFHLRWFTPTLEVDLCGHATLASAFVLWNHLGDRREVLEFHTRSGILRVRRRDDMMVMSFPVLPPHPCDPPGDLLEGLGKPAKEIRFAGETERSGNYLAEFASEEEVLSLEPNFDLLGRLERCGVIATAPGRQADFVSRYFVPSFGIAEDPVTGSTHCTLVPYWSERTGKKRLHAVQVSARGGELFCELLADSVEIGGRAVCYMEGTAHV